MIFFAHAGHDHEAETVTTAPAAAPEPTTAPEPETVTTLNTTAPAPATPANTVSPDILIGGGALLALIVFWLLATYVFKLKLATRLGITMAAFLVVGMFSYQAAPTTSIVALTVGIAMALGIVLTQLSTKKPKA